MESDRFTATRRAGIFGILGNVFLLVIKASIGFATHSQAMIADSANSAGDILASFLTFIGNKIASEPQDDSHNFGHGKAEYIFSLFIGLSMLVVAAKLLVDGFMALFNPTASFSWLLVVVCIITICLKFFLFFYTKKLVNKYDAILLKANMLDHRNDCLVTFFTLVSTFASLAGIGFLDGAIGTCISIWIGISSFNILAQSFRVLMDTSIDEETKDQILNIAKLYPEIIRVDSFSSSPARI